MHESCWRQTLKCLFSQQFSIWKGIECAQSLNQLWSSKLGYMAEQVGTQKNQSPLSWSVVKMVHTSMADWALALIQTGGLVPAWDSELSDQGLAFAFLALRCWGLLGWAPFSTVSNSRKVGSRWRRALQPSSNQRPQIITTKRGCAGPRGAVTGWEEDGIWLCLVTASPHLQFTVNYHFLFNNPVITL